MTNAYNAFFVNLVSTDYTVIARLMVRLVQVGEGPWYLSLDRTNWKFGCCNINILVLGIAHQGMAVPLFWTLLPKTGNSSSVERIALMQRFLDTFGRERIAALLADREFIGRDWFDWLQRARIAFRIRLKANTHVPNRWNKSMPISRLVSDLAPGDVRHISGRRPVWGCFVYLVVLRLNEGKWWIIATTDSPEQALTDYHRRWDIECLFGALKSRGFRSEDTHLTDPERIAKMVALLAIAYAWSFQTGFQRQEQEPIRQKKLYSGPNIRSFDMA